MRDKVYLMMFGCVCGAFMAAASYPLAKRIAVRRSIPEGARFESLDDLRTTIVKRDMRDLKEGGSRSLRSILVPDSSDRIIYRLAPQLNIKFLNRGLVTNSDGMRSPERPVAKGNAVYRIALLGDSFAFGWGVEQKDSFAQRLEDLLNEFTEDKLKIEVLNFGVPGYSTFQEVALFENTGLKYKPDAVLVYFVDNDFGLPFFIKNLANGGQLLSSLKWINRPAYQKSESFSSVQQYLDPNRALNHLLDLGEIAGFKTFLAINPNRQSKTVKQRLWILNSDKRINLIRMKAKFVSLIESRKIDRADLVLKGDPHPSPISHRLLAEILAAKFKRVIKQELTRF